MDSDKIRVINDFVSYVSFSEISSQQTMILDSWEKMLLINSNSYFIYEMGEENKYLTDLINKIIEYSPIKIEMHGWS